MSPSVGMISRVMFALVVLAGMTIVARLYLHGELSRTQLEYTVSDLGVRAGIGARTLIHSRTTLVAFVFLSGFGFGWGAALSWMGNRLRRRPLIIADLRGPNMLLEDCVRHIRINAFPTVDDDITAIRLVLAEAGRGRITLWHRTSADTLWRVSRRKIRAEAPRIAAAAATEGISRHAFVLLSAEVERLWPSLRKIEIGSRQMVHPSPVGEMRLHRAR